MTLKLDDDCFVLDKDRLPHHEALAILKARVRPVVGVEGVRLADAAGGVFAAPGRSPRPIPAPANAPGGGSAVCSGSSCQGTGARLVIAGQASAGHPLSNAPLPGHAVRIFTGAVMPQGFDTVAMQEDVLVEDEGGGRWAVIPPGLRQCANRRLAGEDAKAGA